MQNFIESSTLGIVKNSMIGVRRSFQCQKEMSVIEATNKLLFGHARRFTSDRFERNRASSEENSASTFSLQVQIVSS